MYRSGAWRPMCTTVDALRSPVFPVLEVWQAYMRNVDVPGLFLAGQGIRIRHVALVGGAAVECGVPSINPDYNGLLGQLVTVCSSSSRPSTRASRSPVCDELGLVQAIDTVRCMPQTRLMSP